MGKEKNRAPNSAVDDESQGNDLAPCPSPEWPLWERIQKDHPFPISVMLCVTERCPLNCEHCYIASKKAGRELSLEEIVSLLDELVAIGVLKLTITGGEPGVRKDLLQIIREAGQRHFWLSMKTSGCKLSPESVRKMWQGGLSDLNISLYHVDPKRHDSFVGLQGAWARAVEALKTFQSLGGKSRVSIVAMKWNYASLSELTDFCKKNDFFYTVDPRVVTGNDGDRNNLRHRLSLEAMAEVMPFVRNAAVVRPIPTPEYPVCMAGKNGAYITPSGEVWACPNLPISFGNIRKQKFEEIWRNSEERNRITSLVWGSSSTCGDCPDIHFCQRCPGESHLEHGDLDKHSELDCLVARARALYVAGISKE